LLIAGKGGGEKEGGKRGQFAVATGPISTDGGKEGRQGREAFLLSSGRGKEKEKDSRPCDVISKDVSTRNQRAKEEKKKERTGVRGSENALLFPRNSVRKKGEGGKEKRTSFGTAAAPRRPRKREKREMTNVYLATHRYSEERRRGGEGGVRAALAGNETIWRSPSEKSSSREEKRSLRVHNICLSSNDINWEEKKREKHLFLSGRSRSQGGEKEYALLLFSS